MLVPLLLIWSGCGKPSLKPVEIEPADMCSFCRMAVSEMRYAAEIVDPDENIYKFDDIGCMLRFLREHRPPGAALFVRDYDGAGWINAAEAQYVRSDAIPSPMGGHTIAVKQKPAAEEYARRFHGAVLSWERL
ncbi:MAG TPA: nitrous oxide reductase accessory protein NosL [Bryobacteraceae bacterium]|nr:nitrous oxide reductase accessory protein NosL [Bryobacteraceae bacterium]